MAHWYEVQHNFACITAHGDTKVCEYNKQVAWFPMQLMRRTFLKHLHACFVFSCYTVSHIRSHCKAVQHLARLCLAVWVAVICISCCLADCVMLSCTCASSNDRYSTRLTFLHNRLKIYALYRWILLSLSRADHCSWTSLDNSNVGSLPRQSKRQAQPRASQRMMAKLPV